MMTNYFFYLIWALWYYNLTDLYWTLFVKDIESGTGTMKREMAIIVLTKFETQ